MEGERMGTKTKYNGIERNSNVVFHNKQSGRICQVCQILIVIFSIFACINGNDTRDQKGDGLMLECMYLITKTKR